MTSVRPLIPVSRKPMMPLSSSRDDLFAAEAVTNCQVSCLSLVLGKQSTIECGVQHVVAKCQACFTHLRGMVLYTTRVIKWVAPRHYLKATKASAQVRFSPSYFEGRTLKGESVLLFRRRSTRMHKNFIVRFLRTVDMKFHASVCPCIHSELNSLAASTVFSASNFPTRLHCGGSDLEAAGTPIAWRGTEHMLSSH